MYNHKVCAPRILSLKASEIGDKQMGKAGTEKA